VLFLIKNSFFNARARAGKKLGFTTNLSLLNPALTYRLAGAMLIRDGKPCEDCVGTNLLPSLVHKCYRDSLLATGANAWQITGEICGKIL
jgi:hypothetical protein